MAEGKWPPLPLQKPRKLGERPKKVAEKPKADETDELNLAPLLDDMSLEERMKTRDIRIQQYVAFKKKQKRKNPPVGGKPRLGLYPETFGIPNFTLLPPNDNIDTGGREKIRVGPRLKLNVEEGRDPGVRTTLAEGMMASASSTATSATTATAATSHRSRQSGGPSSRVKHPRKIGMPQEYSCEELEVLECETTHIHRADLGLDDLVASAQHPDTVARSGVVADATERLAASITKGTGAGDGATGSAAEASSAASHGAFGSSFVAGRRGISQYLHRGALTSAVVSGGRGCSQYLDGGAIARAIAGAVAVGDYDFDEEKDDDGEPLVQVVDNGPNMLARNLVHAPTQKEEMDGFIFRPVPEGSYTRCHFVLQDGQYNLLIEQANKTRSCILAAKRDHKVAHIEFLICKTPGPVLKHSALYLGKLRCSLTGNEFTLYNDGLNPNKMKRAKGNVIKLREELLAVHVGKPTGSDGPLKLSVIIPQLDPMDDRVNIVPIDHRETLLRRFKSKDSSGKVVVLQNKPAEWSTEKKGYVLNFNGRVSMSSVKNFQLVHPNNSEYIVLQFGRTSSVQFALDFSYPLCPYQAFALALCGYTKKFGK